jgi:uncharacterized MAPEG superfamily protein
MADSDNTSNGKPEEEYPAAARFFMKLLEPGSGINHGMWAFLNIIFVIIAFLILIMYIADVGGIHTLVFGFLLLGLAASANWLMYELLCARKDQAAAEKKDS